MITNKYWLLTLYCQGVVVRYCGERPNRRHLHIRMLDELFIDKVRFVRPDSHTYDCSGQFECSSSTRSISGVWRAGMLEYALLPSDH